MVEYKNKLFVYKNDPKDDKNIYKKIRVILYLLNKYKTSKPETIKKYYIIYDEKQKVYF